MGLTSEEMPHVVDRQVSTICESTRLLLSKEMPHIVDRQASTIWQSTRLLLPQAFLLAKTYESFECPDRHNILLGEIQCPNTEKYYFTMSECFTRRNTIL